MNEFSRLELLIGDKIFLLKTKTILIIGLGGVGGYIVEALARSSIGNLIIIDKDKVEITNINRQIIANYETIGKYKTDVFETRIEIINKNCQVKKITKEIKKEDIKEIIKDTDYVIDACDDINVKKEIIRVCSKEKIKFISCMGMGKKMDYSKIKIMNLRKTSYDKIAKILRKMVKDENIKGKIPVCCSDEKPINNDKIIGSNAFVPAIAGLMIAGYIVNDIVRSK
jgi:tRNA A37 threonylcarbamoyladenosine dehydratase